jgi:hypothetical protein
MQTGTNPAALRRPKIRSVIQSYYSILLLAAVIVLLANNTTYIHSHRTDIKIE